MNFRLTFIAVLACSLWSTSFVGLKLSLQYIEPVTLAGIRFIVSGLMLLVFAGPPLGLLKEFRRHLKFFLFLAVFQSFILYAGVNYTVELLGGALAAILIGSSPLFIAVLAHFTIEGDRFHFRKAVSLVCGILGISLIVLETKGGLNSPAASPGAFWLGIGVAFVANASSAIGNIAVAKYPHDIHPVRMNAFQIFLGGIFLFVTGWLWEYQGRTEFFLALQSMPPVFYVYWVWLSGVSAVAFSLWFYLLRRPEILVSELNIWKFIMPVGGALLAWMILPGEEPSLMAAWSVFLTGVSIVLIYLRR